MPQHGQTLVKEHYHNLFKYRNNQCYYNCLILEIKITKIRIME